MRSIAPFVRDKKTDPAVLCLDERASFVIPLLSGHIGGANALAARLAGALGAAAVITTATDVNGKFAVDAWAAQNGCAENCDDVAVMYMGRVVEYGTLEQTFTNPLHPYTQALMRSVPVLGMDKSGELESIPGTTPDAATVFTGCEFANRCQRATEACFHRFPKDTVYPDGHRVRCLHYEEGK